MPASPSTSAMAPVPELTRLASRCKSCNCLSRSSNIWLSSLPSYACQRKRILTNRNVRSELVRGGQLVGPRIAVVGGNGVEEAAEGVARHLVAFIRQVTAV